MKTKNQENQCGFTSFVQQYIKICIVRALSLIALPIQIQMLRSNFIRHLQIDWSPFWRNNCFQNWNSSACCRRSIIQNAYSRTLAQTFTVLSFQFTVRLFNSDFLSLFISLSILYLGISVLFLYVCQYYCFAAPGQNELDAWLVLRYFSFASKSHYLSSLRIN